MAALVEQEQEGGLGRRGRRVADGRAGFGPLFLLLPALLFVYGAIWLFRRAPGDGAGGYTGDLSDASSHAVPERIACWQAELELDGGERCFARLTPLHAAEPWQDHDAKALRARFALEQGEPWRLELERPDTRPDDPAAPLAIDGPRVVDDRGVALSPLAVGSPAADGEPADPLRTLFGRPAAELAPGASAQAVLWGREPGGEARLELGTGAERRELPLVFGEVEVAELPRSLARVDAAREAAEARQ